MSLQEAKLSVEDTRRLRLADADRMVGESGHPALTPKQCAQCIVDYYELVEELFLRYDADDEDETYFLDAARGSIMSGVE